MRNRLTRMVLFVLAVMIIGYGFYFYLENFASKGEATPEEALPTDAEYVWIEAEKNKKEQRYFFLSNGNYFGTGTVVKTMNGWKTGSSAYSNLPNPLVANKISSASSDGEILYGFVKPKGNIKILVNESEAKILSLQNLSESDIQLYDIKGYAIWYISLSQIEETKNYDIQVIDEENNRVIHTLSL